MRCTVCDTELKGRQTRYCSSKCKNDKLQHYKVQRERGLVKKQAMISERGGCEAIANGRRCEYPWQDCLPVMEFHHIDPTTKLFNLDSRTLGNRRASLVADEFAKCIVLCANHHRELETLGEFRSTL